MAFLGLDRQDFEKTLKACLSPTQPIRSREALHGRERKLEDIRRALVADGRHIFIHGDRGVGKTSLAQTAAYEHQSSEQNPVFLTCDPSSNFYRLAHDMALGLIASDPAVIKTTIAKKYGGGFSSIISGEVLKTLERGAVPEMRSINEAVSVIDWAARQHSKAPVVLFDEFERVRSDDDRALFADLIKQHGDQSVPVKLIFCGVGSSLSDLLDTHHSCYRS